MRTTCANLLQPRRGRGLLAAGSSVAWVVRGCSPMRGLRLAVIVLALVGLAFAFRGSPPSTVESRASSAGSGAHVRADEEHDDEEHARADDEQHPRADGDVDVAPVSEAPPARTTIAVLRVGDGGDRLELVSWVTKPFACAASDGAPGATFYLLEDALTGAPLASGPCPLPDLCRCGGRDHRQGCVRVRHEAVVRLKLPRLAAAERLTIVGPDGPIAQFALEGTS